MTKKLLDLSELSDTCDGDVLILTPNQRLQRRFVLAHGESKNKKGLQAWLSPNVLALQHWLLEVWQDLQDRAYPNAANVVLADKLQLQTLWSRVIANDPNNLHVINSQSMAGPAANAYKTLQLWQLSDYSELCPETAETKNFQNWFNAMISELNRRNLVTKESTIEIIIQAITEGVVNIPSRVVLFSFDEHPPLFQALFQAIKKAGSELIETDCNSSPTTMVKFGAQERKDQYLLASRWAKQKLEENENATVAIVCPELTSHREEINEALMRVFEPQAILPSVSRYTLPFNFSAGTPLGGIPLIQDGLNFLSLGLHEASIADVTALLRSPYIAGSDKEQIVRTKFDIKLRKRHSNSIKLDNVIKLKECPDMMSELIGNFLIHAANTANEQKPSQWAFHFSQALEHIGWPGDRNLDSEEYQSLTHWHAQLDQLSKLDSVYLKCSRNQAMNLLRQCVNNTIFQTKTSDSPIQVLGLLEAAGLHFSHMWVMDLNDDIWPQAPKPNPFIPMHTQKTLSMPHSSAERELEFSKKIIERLIAGADHLIMSYAKWDCEKELRSSEIIDTLAPIEIDDLSISNVDNYLDILFDSVPLVNINDKHNIPIIDITKIRGGTGILSKQAECPFKAFATYRLRAPEFPKPTLGFSYIERGKLVHSVLEFIWKKLGDQETLLSLSSTEESTLINEAIDFSFFWLASKRKDLGSRLLKLERQRLLTIIKQWLTLEKTRSPFKVIECEQRVSTTVGGLPIQLIRDRVDLIDDKRFHIDYKTGTPSLKSWTGDRPEAPQIPLYATVDKDDCIGAAFGQVRIGESAFKGIADKDGVADGVVSSNSFSGELPESWSAIKEHWTERLEELAKEFIHGIATVTPKSDASCRNCHLSGLCQI